MITYSYRDTPNIWMYKFFQTMNDSGTMVIEKGDFKLSPPVIEWLEEQKYPYVVDLDKTWITFPDDDHAFAFKMRWF